MLKKTIKYIDYDGLERTETHYFGLNKSELTDMQVSVDGGMEKLLKKIVDSKDGKGIMDGFKMVIRKSYGIKSDDGRRFIKSEQLSNEFFQTAAYEALFEELITDAKAGSAFINGILPAGMADSVKAAAN